MATDISWRGSRVHRPGALAIAARTSCLEAAGHKRQMPAVILMLELTEQEPVAGA